MKTAFVELGRISAAVAFLTLIACGGGSGDAAGGTGFSDAGGGGDKGGPQDAGGGSDSGSDPDIGGGGDTGGVNDAGGVADGGADDAGGGGDTGIDGGAATLVVTAAAGGTLVSADGMLTLEIPAGALAADTVVSVVGVPNDVLPLEIAERDPVGIVYDIQPDGLAFLVPATLTIRLSAATIAGLTTENGVPLLNLASYSTGAGIEVAAEETRLTLGEDGSGAVVAEVSHLSDHFVITDAFGIYLWANGGPFDAEVGTVNPFTATISIRDIVQVDRVFGCRVKVATELGPITVEWPSGDYGGTSLRPGDSDTFTGSWQCNTGPSEGVLVMYANCDHSGLAARTFRKNCLASTTAPEPACSPDGELAVSRATQIFPTGDSPPQGSLTGYNGCQVLVDTRGGTQREAVMVISAAQRAAADGGTVPARPSTADLRPPLAVNRTPAGDPATNDSFYGSMSRSGTTVSFHALDGGRIEAYVGRFDPATNSVTGIRQVLPGGDASGVRAISGSGEIVAASDESISSPPLIIRLSDPPDTQPAPLLPALPEAHPQPFVSLDWWGQRASFQTSVKLAEADTNDAADFYVANVSGGPATLLSVGTDGLASSGIRSFGAVWIVPLDPSIAFMYTDIPFVPGDTNGLYGYDLYMRDRDPDSDGVIKAGGVTSLASPLADGTASKNTTQNVSFSPDGLYVAFVRENEGESEGFRHCWVFDTATRRLAMLDVDDVRAPVAAHCGVPILSLTGRTVAYESTAEGKPTVILAAPNPIHPETVP
ncbi:MAG: hypothetical protein HY897_14165 [Deltaproteobacteria bacterium]|nr:hypothetical protein [Deltaproteobacteria bacterium]